MDEQEFRRLLDLFPLVRPRDYHIDSDPSRQSTSGSRFKQEKELQDSWDGRDRIEVANRDTDVHEAFWNKLKVEAEKKVGAEEAKRFCLAFQQVHKKLVHEGLSLEAARNFVKVSE